MTINFDSVDAHSGGCVAATPYLSSYGITITGATPGTTVGIGDTNAFYNGLAMQAPSMPNFLTQCGSNDPVTYTLNFPTLLTSVSFVRPKLLNGPTGISFPEWSVLFLDSTGNVLGSVGEPVSGYFSDQPAKTFTFSAPAIAAMRVNSNNYHYAAFSALLLDDLAITGPGVGLPTVTLISNDALITAPSAIATDGASLFVGNAAGSLPQVLKLPIGGGPVSALYSPATPCCVAALTVVGSNVYWIDPNGDPDATAIFRGSTAGGGITKIYSGFATGQPIVDGVGITTDGTSLYTSDDVQGRVHRLNADGSGITFLGSRYGGFFDTEHSNRIAYSGGTLYIVDMGKAGVTVPSILSLPPGGGAFTTLYAGSPLVSPDSIAVGNGMIYVADVAGSTIWKLPITGGTPTALISGSPFQHIQGLLFHNNSLYVTDAGGGGVHAAIYRVDFFGPPPDTTAPATTATPSPAPNSNVWNNSDVTVGLNATDTGGSGVASITYAINGGAPVTVSGNSTSFSISTEGTTSLTYHATDTAGNVEADHLLTIKIDRTKPFLSLPSGIVVEATSSGGATVTFSATASDGGSGIQSTFISQPSGSLFPFGTTTVKFQATDRADNLATGSFDVTVQDTRAPMLSLPFGMTREAAGPSGAVVTYTASATDAADGSVAVSCSPASGQVFTLGPTTVNCSASDSRGNTASGSFNVMVTDTTPPVLSLPANITGIEATGPSGAVVTFNVTANDLVDGTRPVNCTPASGSTFWISTTTVNCFANDSRGNGTSGSFTVTVRDTTPPNLSVPANITREATGPSGASVTFTTSATDIVDGSRFVSCSRTSGSMFSIGTTTVNCSASDNHGNSRSASFTVTVRDTTAPMLMLPSTMTEEGPDPTSSVPVTFNASSNDLVDGMRPAACTPASGSLFPVGATTVNCSVTDSHGNTATGSFTVNVRGLAAIDTTTDDGHDQATVNAGQTRQFVAHGTFTDGCVKGTDGSRTANCGAANTGGSGGSGGGSGGSSGGSGGSGGGSGGTGATIWSAAFSPSLATGACGLSAGFTSQAFGQDSTGHVSTVWSPLTPIVNVTGTVTQTQVSLTLACTNGAGAPAQMIANWVGTYYEGDVTFNGGHSHVLITGWSSKTSMSPRFSIASAFANGRVYAIGGVAGVCNGSPCSFGPLRTVESYTLSSNAWSPEPSMNVPREGAKAAVMAGKIYVSGGHTSGGDATDAFEMFDGTSWTNLPHMLSKRAQHALVAGSDGMLYAIGGESGPAGSALLASVERFNSSTMAWEYVAPMSMGRYFFAAGPLNNGATIIVAGGATASGVGGTELYDVATNMWSAAATMPFPAVGAAGATIDNVFYVVGGMACGHASSIGQAYGLAVTAPNARPDGWALLGSMPTARNQLGVAADTNSSVRHLYAIGGLSTSSTVLGNLDIYSVDPNRVWAYSQSPGSCGGSGSGSGGSGGGGGPTWRLVDPITGLNSTIATIDRNGTGAVVTALAPGTALVVAEFGSISCLTTNTCATLTVPDTTPPTITAPPNVTVSTDAGMSTASGVALGVPTSSDNIGVASVTNDAPAIFPLGTTIVIWTATDAAGNSATATQTVTVVDAEPPTLTFGAAAPAANAAGWHNTDVSIGFTAADNVPGALSTSHASPLMFTSEGTGLTQTVAVTDAAGNTATFTSPAVNIDKTAPLVNYSGNAGSYAIDETISLHCSASDAGSGVASTTCADVSGPAYSFALGLNSYSADAIDRAGNVGHGSTSFTVAVTSSSLSALVNRFSTNAGVASGLNAKLSAAANAPNAMARSRMLHAFENQVRAQTGHALTPEQAALLLRFVQSLM